MPAPIALPMFIDDWNNHFIHTWNLCSTFISLFFFHNQLPFKLHWSIRKFGNVNTLLQILQPQNRSAGAGVDQWWAHPQTFHRYIPELSRQSNTRSSKDVECWKGSAQHFDCCKRPAQHLFGDARRPCVLARLYFRWGWSGVLRMKRSPIIISD